MRRLAWALIATGLALRLLMLQGPERVALLGSQLRAAALSPDGRWLAGIRPEGEKTWRLYIWETRTGREVGSLGVPHPPAPTNPLSWRADSRMLAVGAGRELAVVDVEAPNRRRVWKFEYPVRDVRYGAVLMALCHKVVHLIGADGKLYWSVPHEHLLHARVSMDGRVLATAPFEEGVTLWSVPERKMLRQLAPGLTAVGLEFVASDLQLATAFRFQRQRERDHGRVYEVNTGRPVGPELVHGGLMGFRVSADGKRLLTRSRPRCAIWDPVSGRVLREQALASKRIDSLSADGRLVSSVPETGAGVNVWDAASGRTVADLEHPEVARWTAWVSGSRWLTIVGGPCAVWEFR